MRKRPTFRPDFEALENRIVPADFWWRPQGTSTNFALAGVMGNWMTGPNAANAQRAVAAPGPNDTVTIDAQSGGDCATGGGSIGALDIASPNVKLFIAPGATLTVTGVDAQNQALQSTLIGEAIENGPPPGPNFDNAIGTLVFAGGTVVVPPSNAAGYIARVAVDVGVAATMTISSDMSVIGAPLANLGWVNWTAGSISCAGQFAGISNAFGATFNVASSGSISGTFGNMGTFIKGGNGTATMRGVFNNRGLLQVSVGTLTIIGQANSSGTALLNGGTLQASVTLEGGWLGGTGTIIGSVTVPPNADPNTVHPGPANTPGTLRIEGTLSMGRTSTFAIDTDGNGNVGRIAMQGNNSTTSLGATSLVVNRDWNFKPGPGSTFSIITGGGIFGNLALPQTINNNNWTSNGGVANCSFVNPLDAQANNMLTLRVPAAGMGLINGNPMNFAGVEDTPLTNVPVAAFATTDASATTDSFSATIDWGDGEISAGIITAGQGDFVVSGSHTYVTGSYDVTVTIQSTGGSSATISTIDDIADAPLTTQALAVSGTARIPLSGVAVASFTDADPAAAATKFTASIEWGDGSGESVPATVVLQADGSFRVLGSETYNYPGIYTAMVEINDEDGSYALITTNVTIAPPVVTLTNPGDQTIVAGTPMNIAMYAWISNGDLPAFAAVGLPFGLSIDSGSGMISGTPTSAAASGMPNLVSVTATDPYTGASATVTFNITVNLPVVTLVNPGNQANTAGDTVSLSLTAYSSSGNAVLLSATGLPPGLTLVDGHISGTIDASAGSGMPYIVTLTATDIAADVSVSVTICWTVT
jgi:hypothetical protein